MTVIAEALMSGGHETSTKWPKTNLDIGVNVDRIGLDRSLPRASKVTRMKECLMRFMFDVAFRIPFARDALYSRQPFPRWPYMYSPIQMETLSRLLLSTTVPGSVVEVGCNQGWTSAYLLQVLKQANIDRQYVGIDTFAGFLRQDIEAEYGRGKTRGTYDNYFMVCKKHWYDYSLRREGHQNVRSYQADAATFDYGVVAPIAFLLIDVDLYRPVLLTLRAAWKHLSPGGVIIVDDCDPASALWDGAHQAYVEFCAEVGVEPEIFVGKLGVLRPREAHYGSQCVASAAGSNS
ncbi:MAG: class I SAM-dependent methyltransferase [Steroidobacteraceae bacterium]